MDANFCISGKDMGRRIVVLGDVDFAHTANLLQGIGKLSEKHGWEILPLHYSQEHLLSELVATEEVNGVIGAFPGERWIGLLLGHSSLPVVNIANQSTIRSVPSVIVDDSATGRLAAEHLFRRGYSSFACGSLRTSESSRQRCSGFAEYIEEQGLSVCNLQPMAASGNFACWVERLLNLDMPTGVFCSDDLLARKLITAAKENGIGVPDRLSVVGVGDSPMDSLLAGIGITSVALPYQIVGYKAARMLLALFAGEVRTSLIRVAPTGIVVRASTGSGKMNALLRRALDLIDMEIGRPGLSVAAVAARLNVSRRLLEIRFREGLGRSPHAEITRRRMALARRLLLEPWAGIDDIAARCGYSDISNFYRRFKDAHASTPALWRKKALAQY